MKNKNTRIEIFHSRLAAYSATATAALLVAPAVADAQVQMITTFSSSYNGGPPTTSVPSLHGANFDTNQTAASGSHRLTFTAGGLFHGSFNVGVVWLGGRAFPNAGSNAYSIGRNIANSIKSFSGRKSTRGISFLNLNDPIAGKSFHTGLHSNFAGALHLRNTGYVGFKTEKNGNTYYGWLRVRAVGSNNANHSSGISLIAKDGDPGVYGAYMVKTAGETLLAGQFDPTPTPEPSVAALGGLALLACGAAGVRELRRRRQQKKAD